MRLTEVLEGLPLALGAGSGVDVTGVTHDSRKVQPGDLFIALVGERFDARAFVPEAVERGAVAIVAPGPAPDSVAVPWIETDDPRRWMGELASRIYGHPDRALTVAGVTGTNGKSTVVALLQSMLEAGGKPCGRIGTLGYGFRDLEFEGERTTPEATDLFAALAAMRDAGAKAVAMEVSSHALSLGRVEGARFDVAVFTNLTRDHFDFYPDYESYYAAKRSLFDRLKPGGRAVVFLGDKWGRRLADELGDAVTCGQDGAVHPVEMDLSMRGMEGRVVTPIGEVAVRSRLLGRLNLENVLSAIGGGVALGLDAEIIEAGIEACPPLPGRLEMVDAGQGFPVLIDFAHTDAALEAALSSIRELHSGPIILVFGCGGGKDQGKRQLMGRVAGRLAELPIVTSDNPRHEDPLKIIAAVEQGLVESGNTGYRVVPDRREAIRRAISVADAQSAVLVAGKGHEEEQIVGDVRHPFSDREEILSALEALHG